mgnify:FL=1|jgi:hypothetical protein
MNLVDYFTYNSVEIERKGADVTYHNLENVIGKRVWICDYRLGEGGASNKPIRAITPKYVEISSNDTLPKSKTVYYSPIHFREIKKGKASSNIIAPYDNTGYRCYPGVSLNIFDKEKDCRDFFVKQCSEMLGCINADLKGITSMFNNKIIEVNELIEKEGNHG